MLKLIQGSFLEGCGVIVRDVITDAYFHLLVHKETESDRLFIEVCEQRFYKEDVCRL